MEEPRRPDPGVHPEQDVLRDQGEEDTRTASDQGRNEGDDVDAADTPEFQIHDA